MIATAGAAGLLAVGCTGGVGGPPPVLGAMARLVSFDSCGELLDWFRSEAGERVTPYGLSDGSDGGDVVIMDDAAGAAEGAGAGAPTSARDSSGASAAADGSAGTFSVTNVQEQGVGEPDLAVTDGQRLVSVVGGTLRVVDLGGAAPTVAAEVDVPGGARQLLVEGDHALVLTPGGRSHPVEPGIGRARPGDGRSSAHQPLPDRTTLTRVDLDGTPRVVGHVEVDADYVDARMVGGVVRVVTRSSPSSLDLVFPSSGSEGAERRALDANRAIVAGSTLEDWLPALTVHDASGAVTEERRAVDCAAVDRPEQFSGFDVVTVLGIDLGAGDVEVVPSAAVVAGAGTVYASSSSLYVTTTRWPEPADPTTLPSPEEGGPSTDVHAFDLTGSDAARYEASGQVRGTVLDQFSLSEHDGHLRVATTVQSTWRGWDRPVPADRGDRTADVRVEPRPSESFVSVLEPDGGELVLVGEVGGLGLDEEIYSTRFVGDLGYVVTFRRTDPLYVVDLRDPTAPRVTGELKIPGYSSYLQLIGEGRLLGVGQDGTDEGRLTGFAESLFDVSDPADPTRLAKLAIPGSRSLAEHDHHALLWWEPSATLVVPLTTWDPRPADDLAQGVLVTTVTDDSIVERGRISHPAEDSTGTVCRPGVECTPEVGSSLAPAIQRSLVVGEHLLTVSDAGLMVSQLTTLDTVSWLPFS